MKNSWKLEITEKWENDSTFFECDNNLTGSYQLGTSCGYFILSKAKFATQLNCCYFLGKAC